jgi:hypothetical protein
VASHISSARQYRQEKSIARGYRKGKRTDLFLDVQFWSERTHEAEARISKCLTDSHIDGIFDEVAGVIDENLLRFDPLVAYFGRFAPAGDPDRIQWERNAAHCVKRDLAWAACERAAGVSGFFCDLLKWYNRGRWPVGWAEQYPRGHLKVI